MSDSLQEVGDVVSAAGGPDEGVGLHGDVCSHQLGCLLTAGATAVAHSVMVWGSVSQHHRTELVVIAVQIKIKSNLILFVTYIWLADVNASVAKCLCF